MKRSRKQSVGKLLKRLLAQHSHLEAYLPYMSEGRDERVMRLMKDKSLEIRVEVSPQAAMVSKVLFPKFNVMSPLVTWSLIWYFLVFATIVYYYVEMGLVLTYEGAWEDELSSPLMLAIDTFTILVLIADMVVTLNSGYLHRGMLIMQRKRIVSRYLRSRFLIDIISVLILIICPASGAKWTNFLKLWLILKLFRVSEIDDFFLRRFSIHRVTKTVYVIFKLMVIIFLLSHVVGLIFYAMDFYFYSTSYYTPPQDYCWLLNSTSYSPIIELSWPLQYLYTLYWGVNTISTISYGDIAPLNPIETNYSIICFCFAFLVYGYVVNQIVKIILWAREYEDQFQNQMIIIDTYMEKMKLSSDLKQEVRDYLAFLHKDERNRDVEVENQMKAKLPDSLRIELLKSAYSVLYSKIYTILNAPETVHILYYLTEKKYTRDQIIFQQGQRSNALLYLHKGLVQYRLRRGQSEHFLYTCNRNNEFLGHLQLFLRQTWRYRCISKGGSLVYIIDRQKMMDEVNSHGILRERLKLIEYQLSHKKEYHKIFYFCFLCHQDHDFAQCRDHFPVFQNIFQLDTEQEKPVRYRKPKYSTLMNAQKMKEIKEIRSGRNKKLLIKVQKRLAKIKKKIQERNKDLEVDIAHDWDIFEPQCNLSKFEEKWNSGF